METEQIDSSQSSRSNSLNSLIQQWIDQHCKLENYVLAWTVTFKLVNLLKVKTRSRLGKFIIFLIFILLMLGVPLAITAIFKQWIYAPIEIWIAVALLFGIIVSTMYETYLSIGKNVCAIGHNAQNEELVKRQIAWDKFWFNTRIMGLIGLIFSAAMLVSSILINRRHGEEIIPGGSLLIIGFLAYQIGEIGSSNLLMCFEARNFSEMKHDLYRFDPLKTPNLQNAINGYNQFGYTTALILAVFIIGSTLLLPERVYLSNPIWFAIISVVYTINILAVILPRYYIQIIVRKFKMKQLIPIQQKLNYLTDQVTNLNKKDYEEVLRLIDIQERISRAPESCLPFSTIGRLFGTLVLPTITFILAILGEAYISSLLQQVFAAR